MTITREQFIRGFNAIKANQTGRDAVENAARSVGFESFDLGSSPVATELERQLAERCRTREDESGPWPEDCYGEDDISLALHYASIGSIRDASTGLVIRDFPTTAEGLWEMWERDKTGPFRPPVSMQPLPALSGGRDVAVEILTLAADLVDRHGRAIFGADEAKAIRDVLGRVPSRGEGQS